MEPKVPEMYFPPNLINWNLCHNIQLSSSIMSWNAGVLRANGQPHQLSPDYKI